MHVFVKYLFFVWLVVLVGLLVTWPSRYVEGRRFSAAFGWYQSSRPYSRWSCGRGCRYNNNNQCPTFRTGRRPSPFSLVSSVQDTTDVKTSSSSSLQPQLPTPESPVEQQRLPNQCPSKHCKVAVIGTGAVGSYYGGRLWEVGHDVHFYLRNENYNVAIEQGLTITSVEGDIYIPADQLQAYNTIESMIPKQPSGTSDEEENGTTTAFEPCQQQQQRPYDWVIVALKSTSLDAIPDLVVPLLSPSTTRVLVIMNGMIEHDLLQLIRIRTEQQQIHQQHQSTTSSKVTTIASSHSQRQVISPSSAPPLQCCRAWYGGMALICCNRIAPAVVDHTYFGLLSAGVASTQAQSPREHNEDRDAFVSLFGDTIVNVAYEDSLLRGRWKKMIWNLPFNGISVAMGGITVDQIVNDPGLRNLAYAIMDETIAVANTELYQEYCDVYSSHNNTLPGDDDAMAGSSNGDSGAPRSVPPPSFVPLGILERAAMMKLSDDMGQYKPSTMLDFVNRRSMEVQYLFRTPLNRARQLGIPVPHLETIVTQIEAYQRLYNLF